MRLHLKKLIVLISATSALSILGMTNVNAQGGDPNLQIIAAKSTAIETETSSIMQNLQSFILAWITPDTSDTTATMSANNSSLGTTLSKIKTDLLSMQTRLNNDLLNNDGSNGANANSGKDLKTGLATQTNLWYANDLVYSSVLGQGYYSKDTRNADPMYNYVKNASGVNLYHIIPDPSWKAGDSKTRYQNYYNTIVAVESFDAYVLSLQAVESKNSLDTQMQTLVTQATDQKNWFAKVASESIGYVLRQILLYESQNFVVMTQLLQSQKQLVAAQAMTNSVLIANNAYNEFVLASYAQGVQPTLK